ncbi:MAG TPA: sialidase family protein, partial [Myxococcaceae bacterium]|nr:sialidase family protein [Myxococcaceae bacterium]
DRSGGKHNGRLYCSWLDAGAEGTDIFLSTSDDSGATWSAAKPVGDRLGFPVDRFDHWLAVDNKTGDVVVSFYDTRNDTTGQRYQTDTYLARSKDGGATFGPDIRVSSESSNEHDCDGIFPCSAINYGNQQGDYEGVAIYDGAAHPIWTDSRENRSTSGCPAGLMKMEEVFSATVK